MSTQKKSLKQRTHDFLKSVGRFFSSVWKKRKALVFALETFKNQVESPRWRSWLNILPSKAGVYGNKAMDYLIKLIPTVICAIGLLDFVPDDSMNEEDILRAGVERLKAIENKKDRAQWWQRIMDEAFLLANNGKGEAGAVRKANQSLYEEMKANKELV